MSPLALAALALLPAAGPGPEGPAAQPQPIDGLARFVEKYVGTCRDAFQKAACEENVKAFRKAVDGKLFSTVVSEQAEMVKMERRGSTPFFLVTPFVDAGGLALTHGVPRRDARGRFSLPHLVVHWAKGTDEEAVAAAMRTGRVELEIVFRPEGAWKLERVGEKGFDEGMRARFVAVRVVDGRTGRELGAASF